MKKTLFTFALLVAFIASHAQPNITNLSYPSSVGLFDLYEISFNLGPYGNPYDPDTISVYAVFTAPDNSRDSVLGFYYEDYSFQKVITNNGFYEQVYDSLNNVGWRIRFTPDAVGTWTFRIYAIDINGATVLPYSKAQPCSFNCMPVSNAKGFISVANARYLKRDVVERGHRHFRSFFPVGPNVAWYYCHNNQWNKPIGIYDYERRIDSLAGNANFMRIWLNRYQSLNLYGPEYTQIIGGDTTVYFDSTLNQKNAAELDRIISYAAENDIAVTLCFFASGDFCHHVMDRSDPSIWKNNPFKTILGHPYNFFSNTNAIRIAKNLVRYVVSRWGYATNIMAWELWNEVTNLDEKNEHFNDSVEVWHVAMSDYLRTIDPFGHCISTSISNDESTAVLYTKIFKSFDFVQRHHYHSIDNAESVRQSSFSLYKSSTHAHNCYSDKPFFMEESGFAQDTVYNYPEKDPHGIDLHNSLWSSLFSSSMGPFSFWWWKYVDSTHLYSSFNPVLTFCQRLPLLSDSFEAYTTGTASYRVLTFDNNIETYYMKNAAEDTIYGWSQDTAFCYQSLRWLTDSVYKFYYDPDDLTKYKIMFSNNVLDPNGYVYTMDPTKRPGPSSTSNSIKIPIENKPVGASYRCDWYNSETGLPLTNSLGSILVDFVPVQQDADGKKYIYIWFPNMIRDLVHHTINNKFGDVVFVIKYLGNIGPIDKTQ